MYGLTLNDTQRKVALLYNVNGQTLVSRLSTKSVKNWNNLNKCISEKQYPPYGGQSLGIAPKRGDA